MIPGGPADAAAGAGRGWPEEDRRWMMRALELARAHRPHPNPRVGCVILDAEGRPAGEGAHRGAGSEHAEQEALRRAGRAARGGSAVVTLEPCSHYGRTPPCAELLAAAGVARVVAAVPDPDRRVSGRGLEMLKRAGIEVSVGLMHQEAVELDPAYHHHRRTGRPLVRLVVAGGLDRTDPAVRGDLESLDRDFDYILTAADLADRGGGGLSIRLTELAERGFLYLGARDGPPAALLRREGLVDAATIYSTLPAPPDRPAWMDGGLLAGVRRVGSHYRIDLVSPPGPPELGEVRRGAAAVIPTGYGIFRAVGYESTADGRHHLALVMGEVEGASDVLVRVHSECLTGDVFASLRCDCGFQLNEALRRIGEEGRGVVLYMRGHEGRGIGLMHKLASYALQERGRDTVEANLDLGLPVDDRDYRAGALILADLGVSSIRLLTNNPAKSAGIEGNGLRIAARAPLAAGENEYNRRYLRTKAEKLGHLIAPQEPDGPR